MKIGQLKVKFEKDEFRKKLEYHISTSDDVMGFFLERQKKWANILPEKEKHIHEGWIMGLKFAIQLLDEE